MRNNNKYKKDSNYDEGQPENRNISSYKSNGKKKQSSENKKDSYNDKSQSNSSADQNQYDLFSEQNLNWNDKASNEPRNDPHKNHYLNNEEKNIFDEDYYKGNWYEKQEYIQGRNSYKNKSDNGKTQMSAQEKDFNNNQKNKDSNARSDNKNYGQRQSDLSELFNDVNREQNDEAQGNLSRLFEDADSGQNNGNKNYNQQQKKDLNFNNQWQRRERDQNKNNYDNKDKVYYNQGYNSSNECEGNYGGERHRLNNEMNGKNKEQNNYGKANNDQFINEKKDYRTENKRAKVYDEHLNDQHDNYTEEQEYSQGYMYDQGQSNFHQRQGIYNQRRNNDIEDEYNQEQVDYNARRGIFYEQSSNYSGRNNRNKNKVEEKGNNYNTLKSTAGNSYNNNRSQNRPNQFQDENYNSKGNGNNFRDYKESQISPEYDERVKQADNNSEYQMNDEFYHIADESEEYGEGYFSNNNERNKFRDNKNSFSRGYGLEGSQVYNVYENEFGKGNKNYYDIANKRKKRNNRNNC